MTTGPSIDGLTPTEARMLAVLDDGQPHRREALQACLHDDLGGLSNIRFHLCNLRAKLRPRGCDILCVLHRRTLCYRLVRIHFPALSLSV